MARETRRCVVVERKLVTYTYAFDVAREVGEDEDDDPDAAFAAWERAARERLGDPDFERRAELVDLDAEPVGVDFEGFE